MKNYFFLSFYSSEIIFFSIFFMFSMDFLWNRELGFCYRERLQSALRKIFEFEMISSQHLETWCEVCPFCRFAIATRAGLADWIIHCRRPCQRVCPIVYFLSYCLRLSSFIPFLMHSPIYTFVVTFYLKNFFLIFISLFLHLDFVLWCI